MEGYICNAFSNYVFILIYYSYSVIIIIIIIIDIYYYWFACMIVLYVCSLDSFLLSLA